MKRVFVVFHRDHPDDIYIRLYGIFGNPEAAVSAQEAHDTLGPIELDVDYEESLLKAQALQALNRSDHVNYLATQLTNAKKPGAAKDFLNFLKSDEAQVILERAGFIPATAGELNTSIPLP